MKPDLAGHLQHMVITGVVGFGFFLLGQFLYPFLTESMWPPIGIAIYFLLFAIVMYVTMFVLNQIRRDYSFWHRHGRLDMWRDAYKRGVLCLLALFLAAGVFEFLYELGNGELEPATSYIFLIDDSGSMQGNDPALRRVDAINAIMSKQPQGFPYAVYGFTAEAELIKPMGPYDGNTDPDFHSEGNTDVINSLNSVLEDLSDGSLQGGSAPRVLLLSDGESSAWGWRKIARDSRGSNVVVSCIGFGYDSGLLRNISERTGGIFIQVNDVDELAEHMEEAITSNSRRNLISSRVVTNLDWLYAILRVLFLSLLGVIWSLMKYETYCSSIADMNDKVFKLSLVMCTLSALLVEILFQYLWISPSLVRLVFCVLWALTPGFFVVDKSLEFKPSYGGSASSVGYGGVGDVGASSLEASKPDQLGNYRLTPGESYVPQNDSFSRAESDFGEDPFLPDRGDLSDPFLDPNDESPWT